MKLKLENYKGTQEEFESLTLLEKRQYITQSEQEETNWWLRTMAKIYVIGFVFIVLAFISIIMNK
jgi:hypothetical protein